MPKIGSIVSVCVWVALGLVQTEETAARDHGMDLSECENCEALTGTLIEVPTGERIDFDEIAPERRLDFLIGEWVLYYPEDRRGTEIIEWHYKNETLHAFQD